MPICHFIAIYKAAMDRIKRSFVWNYFSRSLSDDSKVVCSVCKTELMYSNSTGTMLNHLKSKHPGATAEASNSQSSQKSLDTFAFRQILDFTECCIGCRPSGLVEAASRRLPEPLQTSTQIPMHTRDLRSCRENLFFGWLGGQPAAGSTVSWTRRYADIPTQKLSPLWQLRWRKQQEREQGGTGTWFGCHVVLYWRHTYCKLQRETFAKLHHLYISIYVVFACLVFRVGCRLVLQRPIT